MRENAPWYPEEHLFAGEVDFAINALDSGQAQTLKQALAQYEINQANQ